MDRLVLKKRLASVLSQRKTTIGEEKIESSANDFAENCMKYYKRIIPKYYSYLFAINVKNRREIFYDFFISSKGFTNFLRFDKN